MAPRMKVQAFFSSGNHVFLVLFGKLGKIRAKVVLEVP